MFCRWDVKPFSRLLIVLVVTLLSAGQVIAADGIAVLPGEFTLTGPEARQHLLVERMRDGRAAGQITDGLELQSSNPDIVRVEDGLALPVKNGEAVITATVGERTARARVTVEDVNEPFQWSFRNHVQSVLSKAGCNSGACHGAEAGKNGFKLSLRGYDPLADYHTITRESRGRRIVPSDPARSLILLKPTMTVPHKGGLRFEPGSREYRVLAEWIAAGQLAPQEDDPRLERLEILPEHVVLDADATQQMLVRAHFTDGHTEDVTDWAKFRTTNLPVADVDDTGRVKVMGSGEGAIVGWYLSKNVVASVTVPYDNDVPAEVFAKAERNNFIDDLVLEKLQSLNIPPSPPADDATFLRRAYLDTIGIPPTAEETRRFLADDSPDKRRRLIDELLNRPEFVDYWTYHWSDVLLVTGTRLRPKAVDAYYTWIRKQVAHNTPWDEFVRRIVTARGSTLENGAANFYSLHQDPLDMAETVSKAFMGLSLNCARCHDHPTEKWTNDDYYGMVSLFARVRGKGWGGSYRSGDGDRVVFTADKGEVIQPRTGEPQPPCPPGGEPIAFDSSRDRRAYLADWLTAPENPYFTRAVVNRVWANFMNRGLVEAVDDMRLTNPPSNEKLMAALCDSLVKNDYDLKALMRLILQSKTYQRSSEPLPGNEADERFYARYYPERLQAEVLLDAISQVTGVPTVFAQRRAPGGGMEKVEVARGTRAIELHDTSVVSYFLETFGRPERLITCECERSNEPSMSQVLHIMNGGTLNEKLAAKENRIGKLLADDPSDEEIVERAYLSALARYPTDDEKTRTLEILAEADAASKRSVVEDVYWSLLSSREFLFNH